MSTKLEKWRSYIGDTELETYRKAGFRARVGFGRKAALINIDTTYMFVDPEFMMCGRQTND